MFALTWGPSHRPAFSILKLQIRTTGGFTDAGGAVRRTRGSEGVREGPPPPGSRGKCLPPFRETPSSSLTRTQVQVHAEYPGEGRS